MSDITYREIELAPEFIKEKLLSIPEEFLDTIITDKETEDLADNYIKSGAVSNKFYEDALHIANATIKNADILVSWNFKHIVNIERIRRYNSVNLMFGYKILEIRTPREIIKENNDEN